MRSVLRTSLAAAAALGLWAVASPSLADTPAAPAPTAPPAPTPASEADQAKYQSLISEAVREFQAGHWEEARALFKRAHEIEPNARTLRGMGMAAYELRMYVAALRELEAALRDPRKPLTEEQQQDAQRLSAQARAFVGRYQLLVEPAHARIYVGGQPARLDEGGVLLLNVGAHEIVARADGHADARQSLRVEGGENLVLRLQLTAAPQEAPAVAVAAPAPVVATPEPAADTDDRSGLRLGAWIALGGAAVFGGAAAAFWVIGDGQFEDLESSCMSSCSDQEVSDSGIETSDLLTNVFLGVAAAAGVTSVVLFVLSAGGDEQPRSAGGDEQPSETALQIGPGSVRLRGAF